jgi:hypothetical protein
MSKLKGELSYKDWCILKHGLKNSLHQKESFLNKNKSMSDIVRKALEKEVREEKATLKRITLITNNFKSYIKGKERHYVHRAADC